MADDSEEQEFVLRSDVIIRLVGELSPEVRTLLKVSAEHALVSRPGSRVPSKLVDPPGAELLREFRHLSTIADALDRSGSRLGFSVSTAWGPAHRFLHEMLAAGFLVSGREAQEGDVAPLELGAMVGMYQVVSLLYRMEDTEIYAAVASDRSEAVLKVARTSENSLRGRLQHEALVLIALGGDPAPRLLDSALNAERPYLVLERCSGVTAALAADMVRQLAGPEASGRIIDLCCRILDAYIALHERGVLHGDVHPGNVLVDTETGGVRVIDFDLACLLRGQGSRDFGMRGGDPRFSEPEYARALLAGQSAPPVTLAGEQYSLGVLLYRLLAGQHYLPLELDETALLGSIVASEPLPFRSSVSGECRAGEQVLRRALAKDPERRFASLAEMAVSMRTAFQVPPTPKRQRHREQPREPFELEATLSEYSGAERIATGLPPPTASVNFGAAGVAYFFYRAGLILNRPQLLATADQWLDRAKAASALRVGIYAADLDITPDTVGYSSLYHGLAGIGCVEGLLWSAWGSSSAALAASRAFAQVTGEEGRLDLTSGTAGLLLGSAILHEALAPYQLLAAELIAAAHRFRDHLWSRPRALAQPLIPNAPAYLGMAHGWSGALYATLRWAAASGEPLPSAAVDRLEEVANLAVRFQGRAQWPQTAGGGESWSGWCHGSAGYAHLWAMAHAVTGEERYLELAREAAEDVCARGHPYGHLCCGSAGQAYAMLALYQCTGEGRWVDRARQLLNRALAQVRAPHVRPGSLYAGDIGIAVLAADLLQPEHAAMPLFAPEGWAVGTG